MVTGINVKDWWKVLIDLSESELRFLLGVLLLSGVIFWALFFNARGIGIFNSCVALPFFFLWVSSCSFLFVNAMYSLCYYVRGHIHLQHLARDEKNILLGYLSINKQTQTLRIDSGTVVTLLEMRMLIMASKLVYNYGPFDIRGEYVIKPWVLRYLKKHPNLLEDGVGIEEILSVD